MLISGLHAERLPHRVAVIRRALSRCREEEEEEEEEESAARAEAEQKSIWTCADVSAVLAASGWGFFGLWGGYRK